MPLLALDDPVYVVELTPAALEADRRAFELPDEGSVAAAASPGTTEREIQVVALVFAWDEDPVLLPIAPTRDLVALDATARLLRAAMVTGHRVSELALAYGDPTLRALYLEHKLPAFLYQGIAEPARRRVPAALRGRIP